MQVFSSMTSSRRIYEEGKFRKELSGVEGSWRARRAIRTVSTLHFSRSWHTCALHLFVLGCHVFLLTLICTNRKKPTQTTAQRPHSYQRTGLIFNQLRLPETMVVVIRCYCVRISISFANCKFDLISHDVFCAEKGPCWLFKSYVPISYVLGLILPIYPQD